MKLCRKEIFQKLGPGQDPHSTIFKLLLLVARNEDCEDLWEMTVTGSAVDILEALTICSSRRLFQSVVALD